MKDGYVLSPIYVLHGGISLIKHRAYDGSSMITMIRDGRHSRSGVAVREIVHSSFHNHYFAIRRVPYLAAHSFVVNRRDSPVRFAILLIPISKRSRMIGKHEASANVPVVGLMRLSFS